jgi:hypothetical protein
MQIRHFTDRTAIEPTWLDFRAIALRLCPDLAQPRGTVLPSPIAVSSLGGFRMSAAEPTTPSLSGRHPKPVTIVAKPDREVSACSPSCTSCGRGWRRWSGVDGGRP